MGGKIARNDQTSVSLSASGRVRALNITCCLSLREGKVMLCNAFTDTYYVELQGGVDSLTHSFSNKKCELNFIYLLCCTVWLP